MSDPQQNQNQVLSIEIKYNCDADVSSNQNEIKQIEQVDKQTEDQEKELQTEEQQTEHQQLDHHQQEQTKDQQQEQNEIQQNNVYEQVDKQQTAQQSTEEQSTEEQQTQKQHEEQTEEQSTSVCISINEGITKAIDTNSTNTVSSEYYSIENPSLSDPSSSQIENFKKTFQDKPIFTRESICAIHVSNLELTEGSTKILNGINLFVPKGAIYCLIGPSGCGKTTLLRCLVGCSKNWTGTVKVFGRTPGDPDGEVPGPQVGYMPQDTALYGDMTVWEQLLHFGRMTLCKPEDMKKRAKFLLEFLDMSSFKHRITSTLSGGQVRRLSFAVSLIHSPALLILDEPTAGVDPLLRHSVWCHLRSLTQKENITVIITTHYVEEARQADFVGLMRKGNVLTEEPPDSLLKRIQVNTIEEAFLHLVKQITTEKNRTKRIKQKGQVNLAFEKDDTESVASKSDVNKGQINLAFEKDEHEDGQEVTKSDVTSDDNKITIKVTLDSNHNPSNQIQAIEDKDTKGHDSIEVEQPNKNPVFYYPAQRDLSPMESYWQIIHALNIKNWNRNKRHFELILFQFFFPVVIVILFCQCIGPIPRDIKVGVVNEECIFNNEYVSGDNCTGTFGQAFLEQIDDYMVNQLFFIDLEEAKNEVRKRNLWGVIHIKDNYSEALEMRITFVNEQSDESEQLELYAVDKSTIKVYADLTDKVVQITVQKALINAFKQFTLVQLGREGFNPNLAKPPIVLANAIYGRDSQHEGYTEFLAPGILINISFVMACGLTALIFLLEKRNGMLERMMVCGVKKSQVIVAHIIIRLGTMIISNIITIALVVIWLPNKGSIFWIFTILLLQSCAGMSFGMVVSTLTASETAAAISIASIVVANITLCGVIWPVEAIPYWIRWVSISMPSTLPTEALRGLMNKGWGIDNWQVQLGLYSCAIWFTLFAVTASKLFKFK